MTENIFKLILASLIVFATGLFATLFFTPIVRRIAIHFGVVDLPSARRVNKVPIPRMGGISLIFGVSLATIVLLIFARRGLFELPQVPLCFAWLACVLIGFVGFYDDLRNMRPCVKLFCQLFLAIFCCFHDILITLPPSWGEWAGSMWVCWPLTIIWIVGLINAFNLIDGLDGLASGLALIACIGLSGTLFFTGDFSSFFLFLPLMGALLGFLRYNYYPATIFLGDTGSMFLGAMLALLPLLTKSHDTMLVSVGIPILCAGVPLLDTFLAIIRRTIRYFLAKVDNDEASTAGNIMAADKSHLHHRILSSSNGKQRIAVGILYGISIFLILTGFSAVALREKAGAVFLVAFVAFSFLITRYMTSVELWDTGRLASNMRTHSLRRSITIPLYLIGDCLIVISVFVFSMFFVDNYFSMHVRLNLFLIYTIPIFLLLIYFKAYRKIWSRASMFDASLVVTAVFLGSIISHAVIIFYSVDFAKMVQTGHLVFALVLPLPILAFRFMKTAILNYSAHTENIKIAIDSKKNHEISRAIFYGAGTCLSAYLDGYNDNLNKNTQTLIAILDDDLNMKGRFYSGLPVIGMLEDMPELLPKYKPTKIIITSNSISETREKEIITYCNENNIEVYKFRLVMENKNEIRQK